MNYFYNVLINLRELSSWSLFLIGMAFAACFIIWFSAKFILIKDADDEEAQKVAKLMIPFVKLLGIIFTICLFLYILIPDTYYLKDIIRGR